MIIRASWGLCVLYNLSIHNYRMVSEYISYRINWRRTPQGFDYWERIRDMLGVFSNLTDDNLPEVEYDKLWEAIISIMEDLPCTLN